MAGVPGQGNAAAEIHNIVATSTNERKKPSCQNTPHESTDCSDTNACMCLAHAEKELNETDLERITQVYT